MSEPRERIKQAIQWARSPSLLERSMGRVIERFFGLPPLEILARCAEALLKEHVYMPAREEDDTICACQRMAPCSVLLEIVKPAKEEA